MYILGSTTKTIEKCSTKPVLRLYGSHDKCHAAPNPDSPNPFDDSYAKPKLIGSTLLVTIEKKKTYISWLNEGDHYDDFHTKVFNTETIFSCKDDIKPNFQDAIAQLSYEAVNKTLISGNNVKEFRQTKKSVGTPKNLVIFVEGIIENNSFLSHCHDFEQLTNYDFKELCSLFSCENLVVLKRRDWIFKTFAHFRKWMSPQVIINGDYGFESYLFDGEKINYCENCCEKCVIEIMTPKGELIQRNIKTLFNDKEELEINALKIAQRAITSIRLTRHLRMTKEVIKNLPKEWLAQLPKILVIGNYSVNSHSHGLCPFESLSDLDFRQEYGKGFLNYMVQK
ncbi:hypothetical protein ROZALSC1DRAFT_30394 [Rozella allomycis CSF55]|uniref:Uncharacterized protein n=1 Tax=Rozella allomycis (strain CSF55) TaxID=988480 RepID=A0A075B3Q0_ROZAC|nr:hypothetical protein O9G_006061 [Rozella allomycis CSF55]RKP17844.1 hypothetical protein ROZALSC1DRAFT_30394 [Rozella allomycis CSF55]|eukprot:EPZ35656.1 hypothetical protein O9G_006061 [Rozella allomycis CSF55]